MFKSILTMSLWAILFLWGGTQGWSGEDMEDRFIDPDLTSSKSIFIDVKDVSLVNVLKIISQQSGLSFIANQDVQDRKITLYLNKVPLSQALSMILDANNLTYQMQPDDNIFVVMNKWKTEKTKITRVYQLKYATVHASQLNHTLSFSLNNPGSISSSSDSSDSTSPSSDSGSVSSSSNAKRTVTTGVGLEDAVKNALSPDGKIIEDPRTNSLIITDVPAQFDVIESTIARLDVPVPQVLIEVEMLDVSKSVADQMGVTWGATPISFQGSTEAVNYPLSASRASSSNSVSGSSSSSLSSGSNNSPFSPGTISTAGLTAQLSFLTTHTDARTLARPRILTLNNQTAQIEISTDQAISLQQVQATTTGSTGQNVTTPERYTTGVILKVTPQANLLTREITMAVSPKVIDVILSQVQATGSGTSPIYDPETRGSDSILKLKDGQSMVIGGLMTNQTNKTTTIVPILGNLPIIGALFRSTNKTKDERELVIFLTPHIIDDSNQTPSMDNSSSPSPDRSQEIYNSLNNFDSK